MNIFELFKNENYDEIPVMYDGEDVYCAGKLKIMAARAAKKLVENPQKNILISSEKNLDFVVNFLAAVYAKKEIFLLSDPKKASLLNFDYIFTDKPDFCDNPGGFEFELPDFEETFVTFFTSGSSGSPKSARKNFVNFFVETADVVQDFGLKKETGCRIVTSTKPHHMFGFIYWLFLWIYDPFSFKIDVNEVVYPDSADLKDTIFISSPSFLEKFKRYEVFLKEPPEVIFTAGDKLAEVIYDYFQKYNTRIIDIYGSTETGTIAYKSGKNDEFYHCMSGVEVSADNNAQIVVDSPYFQGKSRVLCDIIELSDSKTFSLKNRSDRIVKIQEKRVSMPEIEDYLNKNELVADSYCFKNGEKLACAAVLSDVGKKAYLSEEKGGRTALVKELKSFLAEKSEIIPQRWRFLYEIPKNKNGKTDKDKIEAIFNTNISFPLILNVEKEENRAEYELVFPKNSNFFNGHFKNFPVLPGVVQLYFAHWFAQDAFCKNIRPCPVKKIKFSHLIKPDVVLRLELVLKSDSVNYVYKCGENICSGGVFRIGE